MNAAIKGLYYVVPVDWGADGSVPAIRVVGPPAGACISILPAGAGTDYHCRLCHYWLNCFMSRSKGFLTSFGFRRQRPSRLGDRWTRGLSRTRCHCGLA